MKRGFLLLEVVIAVGLLVVGMALVGMQIHNSSRASRQAERSMRTLLLAESKLAELDSGLIVPEEEIEEEFGPLFPDYAWRLLIEPHPNVTDLNQVTLEILYQARQSVQEEFDFDEAEVVQRLYTLRATPKPLDLTRDFGMSEADADNLTEQLSGVTDGGIDPRNLDPSLFAQLDLEELLEVAPALLAAFGMNVQELMNLLPEELRQMLEEAQAEFEGTQEESQEGAGAGGAGVEAPGKGDETDPGAGGSKRPTRRPGGRRPGGLNTPAETH